MDKQYQEQIGDRAPAEPKAEWTRPELSRLYAGVAEAGDVSNPDGSINS